ncbi:peptidoglycan binding domain-containing protein [Ophiostoma piceae UAMH 11346]|uniref:Peptidoglycan binding domain-containing protein n=1 Tax=Ophiostoma piceae (strain UAMH 11346) TaxID=1262450 RepID=S3C4H4_OPHP1|nr:peptidoglycan binding domain-containing protein [Ophiostoma piceae UAMH 11346]
MTTFYPSPTLDGSAPVKPATGSEAVPSAVHHFTHTPPSERDLTAPASKTLVVCCDGTWVNAVGKNSLDSPPTNVSRLIRVLRQNGDQDSGHRSQILLYHPGVGSSGHLVDKTFGGAFGMGLDQDICEMYQFICLNYVGGDSIVLVGFSRGAFTARSVADLVATVGLLTPEGQGRFYDIFEDYENMANLEHTDADFICPAGTLEPSSGEEGEAWIRWENRRKTQYRAWLKAEGYSKDSYLSSDGRETEITIKAVAVWDTVGSLGIPAAPVIGLKGSSKQWKFTNTQISRKVENAFQALALDEPRYDFLPSLWERLPDNTTTNLRQVWFPGSHSNIGGGWEDQQMANLTLAWMCDQLAGPRVGVVFDDARLAELFKDGLRYDASHPFPHVTPAVPLPSIIESHSTPLPWAAKAVYASATKHARRDAEKCPGKYQHSHPDGTLAELWGRGARPWALGQIRMPSWFQRLPGKTVRKPGQFIRVDPSTNIAKPNEPLLNTNESVHVSARVRLACGGLDLDDKHPWPCTGLTGETAPDEDDDDKKHKIPLWRLERVDAVADVPRDEPSSRDAAFPLYPLYPLSKVAAAGRWQWAFAREEAIYEKPARGDRDSNCQMPTNGPPMRALPEELPTGRYERLLLGMTAGSADVLSWAAANPPLQ